MTFEQILNLIRTQEALIIYAILLFSAITENIIPPFPGDLVTLAGAFVAGEGNISYIGVFVAVLIGGIIGGMSIYYFGKYKGRGFLEKNQFKFIDRNRLEKVDKMFAQHGAMIIVFSRFMAGIRSIIILASGIAGMPAPRVGFFTFISIILWNAVLIGLMVITKSNWDLISKLMSEYSLFFATITTIILLILIIRYLWSKKKN